MPGYKIEIEIYEGKGGELQKDGEEIIYPDVVIDPTASGIVVKIVWTEVE
jgi:hypothetical protein